tara:strand:- start:344 stop:682 length:339 start_codon:yes stop_codon:yes gene_type:complete
MSNELSTLTVDNTAFKRCSAKDGGAVYAGAGTATFSNCVFEDNEAAGLGGALYVGGPPLDGLAKVVLRGKTNLFANTATDPSSTDDAKKSRLESIYISSVEDRALMYQLPGK